MTRSHLTFLVMTIGLLLAIPAQSATYFIDFDGGNDANTGLSPQAAFKHCPGDPQAGDAAAATILLPDDTVIFKGSVRYRGAINVTRGGSLGKPVTFDGNTAGTFGEGRAIIDGSEDLGGWTRCASAAECNGNPNWQNIWWTEIDPPANGVFHVNLCEGPRYMGLAQDPNPTDLFYQDRIDTYVPLKNPLPAVVGASMEYADAAYFNQADAGYWGDDAYIAIYCRTNRVYRLKLRDYIPAENKIRFDILQADQYPAGQGKFTMFNALTILDQPGEYYVKLTPEPNGKHRLYAWPYDGVEDMTLSKRHRGFVISNSNVVVRGFILEKFSNGALPSAVMVVGANSTRVTVEDNEIRLMRQNNEPGQRSACISMDAGYNSHILNNTMHENMGMHGIHVEDFREGRVDGNTLIRCGATALVCYRTFDSSVSKNVLRDNYGMHANGLTLYEGCRGVRVEGNRVSEGNVCLTAQDGGDFVIRNNVFDGNGTATSIAFWALYNMYNVEISHNTLVNAGSLGGIYGQNTGGLTDVLTVRNNIIDGTEGSLPGTFSHNIFTSRGNHSLNVTEQLITDMNLLFVDPAGEDYHLLAASPAVDFGTDAVVCESDFDGAPRYCDAAPDAGAYELPGLRADPGPDRLVADIGGDGRETVTFDGSGSSAPNSPIIHWEWREGATLLGSGPVIQADLAQGVHAVTLLVVDARGIINADSATVEVRDMLVADAGDDRVVVDRDGNGLEFVHVDGQGSYDPNNGITLYAWYVDGANLALGPVAELPIPLGGHTVRLDVYDASMNVATDQVDVTVLAPGDADGNGHVDIADFVILKRNYGRQQGATPDEGDFNEDGAVDLQDFVILKQHYGQ